MLILLIVVCPSVLVILFGIAMSRVAAASDRASEASARGLLLRALARRVGDRRGWRERRIEHKQVLHERRVAERRQTERRVEPVVADPRP
jgi:hypothetical protein